MDAGSTHVLRQLIAKERYAGIIDVLVDRPNLDELRFKHAETAVQAGVR